MINKIAISLLATSIAVSAHAAEKNIECERPLPMPSAGEEWSLFQDTMIRAPAAMSNVHREYYGGGLDNFGDLRLPEGEGPFPVVIVVHGGRWSANVSLDYIAPMAEMLTQAGVATWNVEYSRIGSGGDWPGSFQTLASATDHVRELAERYPLNTGKVVTIGHSSGGHYALWLAGRNTLKVDSDLYVENPLEIDGAVILDGVVDLDWHSQLPRGENIQPRVIGKLEGDQRESRLQETSPSQMPIIETPQVFISNQSDRDRPVRDYVARASSAGADVWYHELCDSNHFVPVDTHNDEVMGLVTDYVMGFLE